MWVVADIGGTNSRIAIVQDGEITNFNSTPTASISDIGKYLSEQTNEISPDAVLVGCAGPVVNGTTQLTHADLYLDERTLSELLDTTVTLVNDAVMTSASLISSNLISGRHVFVTIGTDVGVSLVVKNSGRYIFLPTEFTHILQVLGVNNMSIKSSNLLSLCNIGTFYEAELLKSEQFEAYNHALNRYISALIMSYMPSSISLYGRVFNYPVEVSLEKIDAIIKRTNVSIDIPSITVTSDEMLPVIGGINFLQNRRDITIS